MILTRGNATGPTRFGEIEWEWRKKSGEAGSMPTAEDAGADVAQVYDEVRAAIALGETMFPWGATSTDKAMQRYQTTIRASQGQGALGSVGGAAGAANAARAGL